MNARDRIYPVTDSYCDRCGMESGTGGALYAVDGDLPGEWAYCGPCAGITADVIEALEGSERAGW